MTDQEKLRTRGTIVPYIAMLVVLGMIAGWWRDGMPWWLSWLTVLGISLNAAGLIVELNRRRCDGERGHQSTPPGSKFTTP